MFLVLWQSQHLTHLQMVFVYAAAPHPPTSVSTKQIYQYVPEWRERMEPGRVERAPGISWTVGGGYGDTSCMHMKEHYCHNQFMRSYWL